MTSQMQQSPVENVGKKRQIDDQSIAESKGNRKSDDKSRKPEEKMARITVVLHR